ncbi:lipocalin-like [Denticeps clupeoides]|uniref:Lipocalin/cytosolic fatty-acid binding domain-containing protein n=1 Tax=Denticeps clupeoides TaxID=299321 RepID=A0A8C4D6B1_9TELE|nr:lipocalin-like [Denticeps clupeoides]
MSATVLKLFGVLLCSIIACADVMPMENFDLQKMSGKWYMIGFASDADWFVTRKADMKMAAAMMVPTATGDLDMSHENLKSDGTCWRMTFHAKKTDTPGRFTFFNQRWRNDNDMRVVDAQFDKFALVHTIKTKDGKSEVLNKMYSRGTDLSPELQDKFRKFCMSTGILPENIAFLPHNGECPQA